MRLTGDTKAPAAFRSDQNRQFAEGQTAFVPDAADFEEPATLLELSFEARNSDKENSFIRSIREKDDNKTDGNGVDDPTRRLTRRLVAAKSVNEVYAVISEAYKSMGDILQAAAAGDKDAANILKKVKKLLSRATRKIRDLGKEEDLRRKERRAKQKEIEHLARQLEQELKRTLEKRKQREKKYLRDVEFEHNKPISNPNAIFKTPSDAKIKAVAKLAAKAAVMSQPVSSNQADIGRKWYHF